jgi:two-component system cell cycle response regulator
LAGRILVVEQKPPTGRGVSRLLASHGYQFSCVTTSATALSLAQDNRFAIVIADLQLPGINGLSFIDLLASANPRTRFVLLTDAPDVDVVAGCANPSAIFSVLHKPLDEDELLESVREALAVDVAPTTGRHSLIPCTTLLVEDNDGDEGIVRDYLADTGFYCIERARRLGDAIEMLDHRPVDVILTDLSLPDAAGLDSVRRLARHTPRTALVVLSGLANEDVALQAVQIGAQDYLIKGQMTGPLLHRSIRHARERKRLQLDLSRLAHNDVLTGLSNRVSFRDHVDRGISRAKRHRAQFAALYLDLDGFKTVNDIYGHEAGDSVLIEVARRLTAAVRPSDVVARLGGDEFALFIEDVHGVGAAIAVAKRILMHLAVPLELIRADLVIAASIGIAMYPDVADDFSSLLAAADEAMYAAKRLGRHSYEVYQNPLAYLSPEVVGRRQARSLTGGL